MKNSSLYNIDHLTSVITISKKFLKESGVIGSDSYHEMLRLRQKLPEYKVEIRESKKPHRTKIGSKLTYEKMRNHIEAKEGKESPMLAELEKVMKLAKCQDNPFHYTKTWFLARYKNDFAAQDAEETAADNIIALHNN